MLRHNFINLIPFLFSKKVFKSPEEKDILIYDAISSDKINIALRDLESNIFSSRGEVLNIYILVRTFIVNSGKVSFFKYLTEYIKITKTKVIISYLGLDKKLIKLKKYNPNIKIIAIQNGLLTKEELNYYADNMDAISSLFVFSNDYKNFFKKKEHTKIFSHGSLINNQYIVKKNANEVLSKKDSNNIYFISQIREVYLRNKKNSHFFISKSKIYWKDFYKAEQFFLPFLKKFCDEHNYNLNILGCFENNILLEKNYFEEIIGNKIIYHQKDLKSFHYENVLRKDNFVSIDSALGYEILSRKKKICLFPIRGNFINTIERKFGWPNTYSDIDEFWCNILNTKIFSNILENMMNTDKEVWNNMISKKAENAMSLDLNNEKFYNIVKHHLLNENNDI